MLASVRHRLIGYVMALTASPTQFGVGLMAWWFASNGPGAYLTCPTMLADPMQMCTTEVLGIIPVTVNLCHMLCHLITGIIGVIAVLRFNWALWYALLGGLYYVAWGLAGILGGVHVRHHLGVDAFGSWVHVIEGVILGGLWLVHRLTAARSADAQQLGTF